MQQGKMADLLRRWAHAAAHGDTDCGQHAVGLMSLAVVVARTACLQRSAACPHSHAAHQAFDGGPVSRFMSSQHPATG